MDTGVHGTIEEEIKEGTIEIVNIIGKSKRQKLRLPL
jgi:hypothetical protein